MQTAINDIYANPSSLHAAGLQAEKAISRARTQVLTSLGARDPAARLVFCASGSEADNLALRGVMHAKEKFRGARIVITDSEHPAIEECAAALEREGYEVIRIPTHGGQIDATAALGAINARTVLLSMMTVNNETGAIYGVADIFRAAKAKKPDLITHTDAVQAFLKIPLSPDRLCADLITLSAHKVHGPKGVGALYIAGDILKRKDISPIIFGGGQEQGLRSGTENTIGIVGFGAACEQQSKHLKDNLTHLRELRARFINALPPAVGVKAPANPAAHIINITLPDIKSETMLHYLSARGIYVSSGSACSSHRHGGNRVLAAFGTSAHDADCSLRISLCAENTADEMTAATKAIADGIRELVPIHSKNRNSD